MSASENRTEPKPQPDSPSPMMNAAPLDAAPMSPANEEAERLDQAWRKDPRWEGVERPYSAEDVLRLRGSVHIEHSLARLGAERLWALLQSESYVNALGALTGNQAVQQVQ